MRLSWKRATPEPLPPLRGEESSPQPIGGSARKGWTMRVRRHVMCQQGVVIHNSLLLHHTPMRSVCQLGRQLVFGSGAVAAEPRLHSKDGTQSGVQRRYRPVTPLCQTLRLPDLDKCFHRGPELPGLRRSPTEVRSDGGKHRPDRVETGGACRGLEPPDATELVRASATKQSEVAAETCDAAAPGLSIRRGEAGGDAPSSSRSESSDPKLTRREGIVERNSKVVGPFSNGGGSVGSALSVVRRQRRTMPTQTERRECQDGMFMPKAALAHLMAAIRQDVTRVTCLAYADRLRVHNIYLITSVCYRIVLKKKSEQNVRRRPRTAYVT
ncbi:unnamed protein product [Boreogadus saida]